MEFDDCLVGLLIGAFFFEGAWCAGFNSGGTWALVRFRPEGDLFFRWRRKK